MSIESPHYWIGVVALIAVFAVATALVANERVDLPLYRVAITVYVLAWIGFGAVSTSPPSFGSL